MLDEKQAVDEYALVRSSIVKMTPIPTRARIGDNK